MGLFDKNVLVMRTVMEQLWRGLAREAGVHDLLSLSSARVEVTVKLTMPKGVEPRTLSSRIRMQLDAKVPAKEVRKPGETVWKRLMLASEDSEDL